MKIGVLILEGPYQHQAVDSAYRFMQAARARGHEIVGAFLYTDGVNNATRFIKPAGERNLNTMLDQLGAEGIRVVACGACAVSTRLSVQVTSASRTGFTRTTATTTSASPALVHSPSSSTVPTGSSPLGTERSRG